MSTKKKRSGPVYFERKLLKSKAYRALRTRTAYFVFGMFMSKRQLLKVGRPGKKQWVITNNGEIVFTYEEAETKYAISSGAFRSAIDELRDKGFIDIAESGAGLHKSANLYSISNRWRLYDTPEYRPPKPRPHKPINGGFKKGNRYGRNCEEEKISTVTL